MKGAPFTWHGLGSVFVWTWYPVIGRVLFFFRKNLNRRVMAMLRDPQQMSRATETSQAERSCAPASLTAAPMDVAEARSFSASDGRIRCFTKNTNHVITSPAKL